MVLKKVKRVVVWGLPIIAVILISCKAADSFLSSIDTPQPTTPALAVSPGATLETPAQSTESPVSAGAGVNSGPRFAAYEEIVGEVSPQIRHQAVASDLGNVNNAFVLSKPQIEHLARDGFVVSPGREKEFFALYEKARYDNVPIFATSDALLHSYHLMFDKVLRTAEAERFIPLLKNLNRSLLAEADRQYRSLAGTHWQDAGLKTVAYFGVASILMDPTAEIPDYATDLVQQELSLIQAAAGIQPSPIFPGLEFGEDYTQYIPRGHYTLTEELKAYFRSMMWYGRMTFRLKGNDPDVGREETRSALLVLQTVRNASVDGKPALDAWAELYAPTVFFVGRSDDLTIVQYDEVFNAIYGASPDLPTITDEARLNQFIERADQLPAPRILGIVISENDDEQKTTKGLRFMGQRFVPDAYIFRQLIYRNVGTNENRRGLPKGLDVLAAMGSERAYRQLETMGDTNYENYPQQMEKVRKWLSGLTVDDWTETLYNTWLYTFFPLIERPTEGYPAFMLSDAWLDKQLNTTLGSWAELKHDTILYAKQVYAEMGGGPPPPSPVPPRGYVEPVPVFYARLAALTAMTHTGLETRSLLNDADREGLMKLEDLARTFQIIAEKELRGEPLTEEEFERIRYYGGELEDLVMRSADTDASGDSVGNPVFMEENQQAAVIADVATDPDPGGTGAGGPLVLEVGVGRINEIHAVVPLINPDGSTTLQVAKGGVFSYYEFPWPAQDRLTDDKWREMLEANQAPPVQDWMKSFLVEEGEYGDLRTAVDRIQGTITLLYWMPMDVESFIEPVTEWLRPELDRLNSQKQYIGHQLVRTQYRSYDLQSPTKAVVTVRETWQDSLHAYTGDYPNYDEAAVSRRGPYDVDVTYTLAFQDDHWSVTQAVYNTQPPGW